MLDEQVRDATIVTEGARRAGISVTADDLQQRIDESLKFAVDEGQRKQILATPRWILEERLRTILQLEKLLKITISENDARDFFQANPKFFIHPASVHLICIASNNQANAESALKQLKDNVDPGKVSTELSSDEELKAHKGDIGWVGRESMTPPVEAAIFAGDNGNPLKPKQFTGIIKDTSRARQRPLSDLLCRRK